MGFMPWLAHGDLKKQSGNIENENWAYVFGFIAGLLGGAYNTNGPPFVMYGAGRGWGREEFKSNMQGLFILSRVTVLVAHFIEGNLTAEVFDLLGIALLGVVLGTVIGLRFDQIISPDMFRRAVLYPADYCRFVTYFLDECL